MRALATLAVRGPIVVILLWVAAIGGIQAWSVVAGSDYRDSFVLEGTDSQAAQDLLAQRFPQAAGDADRIVWAVEGGDATNAATAAVVQPVLDEVAELDGVQLVLAPFAPESAGQVSPEGDVAFAIVQYDRRAIELPRETLEALTESVEGAATDSVEIAVGGQGVAALSTPEVGATEAIGVAFAAAVLYLAFGSLTGMMLPIIAAFAALGVGTGVVALLSNQVTIGSSAPVIGILLGLGVGIDYALFIVNRFRGSLLSGMAVGPAVVRAMDTSGRAVVFAGVTVCIALLGMFVPGIEFLYGIAITACVCVIATVLAATTLLPALLSLLGPRVLRRRDRVLLEHGETAQEHAGPFFAGWAGAVSRRPWVWAVTGIVVMLTIAVPTLDLRLGTADQGNDPAGTTTRTAYDLLDTGFGPGFNGPLIVVVDTSADPLAPPRAPPGAEETPPSGGDEPGGGAAGPPPVPPQLTGLVEDLARDPAVASVVGPRPSEDGTAAVLQVYPTTSPQDEETEALLERIRTELAPAAQDAAGVEVRVGGAVATFADFADEIAASLPLFFGFVIGLSFLLLVVAFRSLLVPLVGAVMNLVSIGAAFGIIVAVFQWGWGADLLGVGTGGPVEPFVPVILFAILFGLSMDYQVFLVSRIAEEWHARKDNREAVRAGHAETGKVIVAAASIMVFVFGAFVLGDSRLIKLIGLGMASAVLLDALVVRMVVVPAVMSLVGPANWWIPAWLDRVLPHVEVEGGHDEPAPPSERRAALAVVEDAPRA